MTRLFFFDTETTGLPRNYNAPSSDTDNWPHIVEIAWAEIVFTDDDNAHKAWGVHIIKPWGFEIPEGASAIHGITTEKAHLIGDHMKDVLELLLHRIQRADIIVGHNITFDMKVLGAEFIRRGFSDPMQDAQYVCTMQSSTKYCAIPGRFGFKWPKLQELHVKLFGNEFEGAHGALADIEATIRCYFELCALGVIEGEVSLR
jgi:DNA polymerase III epsilon subunit-like protein